MMSDEKTDKGTIVYVGGLVNDVTKEDLEAEFDKFGKLNRVWVAFNPPGFAFVEYDKKEDAESAVNALHNATVLGSKLRVEVSRGRGRGRGRGGSRGEGGGDFRGGRGGFRGRGGRGDFGGSGFGRGGFGSDRPPFDRNRDFKAFMGGVGGRFDDYEGRRSGLADRDFGGPRDFAARRDIGAIRDYEELDTPRGYGAGRDFPSRDMGGRSYGPRDADGRDFAPRDIGGRDFGSRDMGVRDYGARDFPTRDIEERGYADERNPRDFVARDYGHGVGREINGARGYGGSHNLDPVEKGYAPGRDIGNGRGFGGQATHGVRDYGAGRDVAPVRDLGAERDFAARDIPAGRDFGGSRDIGLRRDFNPPRDLGGPRDFGGRPSRADYVDNDRFGASGRGGFGDGDVRRAGGFDGGRFSGGDVGGSGDYAGYGARDRFRSRSPIGRVSRPIY